MSEVRHLMGSSYFFGGYYPDYTEKDKDYVIYKDSLPLGAKKCINLRSPNCSGGKNEDIFIWKKFTPEEFISLSLETKTPMQVGKFLIKEANEEIGFTIEHLKRLKPVFDRLDDRHKYEKAIFESYLENNDFKLTESQMDEAYKIYKENKKS